MKKLIIIFSLLASIASAQDGSVGAIGIQPNGGSSTSTIAVGAFAGRPGSPTEGTLYAVTDSTTAIPFAVITGGGTNHVLGYYNGTNWSVAAVSVPSTVIADSVFKTNAGAFFLQTNTFRMNVPTTHIVGLSDNGGGTGVSFATGGSVTLTSGWGTGATAAANPSVGRITVGTTPAGTGVLTFGITFTNAPYCNAYNETTKVQYIPVSTTTAFTITGAWVANDVIVYFCTFLGS